MHLDDIFREPLHELELGQRAIVEGEHYIIRAFVGQCNQIICLNSLDNMICLQLPYNKVTAVLICMKCEITSPVFGCYQLHPHEGWMKRQRDYKIGKKILVLTQYLCPQCKPRNW